MKKDNPGAAANIWFTHHALIAHCNIVKGDPLLLAPALQSGGKMTASWEMSPLLCENTLSPDMGCMLTEEMK